MIRILAIIAVTFAATQFAHAQSSSSSSSKIKAEDVTPSAQPSGEDADNLITNKKMRAEAGSKSKYSLKSKITYNGGNVASAFSSERPNIAGHPGETDVTALIGDISGKYAINSQHSVAAGLGVRYLAPTHGLSTPDAYKKKGDKVDANDPYVYYQYLTKIGSVQTVLGAKPTLITQANRVNAGYATQTEMTSIFAYDLGTSGLTLAMYFEVTPYTFTRYSEDDTDLYTDIAPYVEYHITDHIDFRAVTNLYQFDHVRGNPWTTWTQEKIIQSVGVGFSITRDVYLYPNFQFDLADVDMQRTNVALQSFINLF